MSKVTISSILLDDEHNHAANGPVKVRVQAPTHGQILYDDKGNPVVVWTETDGFTLASEQKVFDLAPGTRLIVEVG